MDSNLPDELRYEAILFFATPAELDAAAASAAIDDVDDGEDILSEIAVLDQRPGLPEDVPVGAAWELQLGGLVASVLHVRIPFPEVEVMAEETEDEQLATDIRAHVEHALVQVVGGDDLEDVEKIIFLNKIILALSLQGAFASYNTVSGNLLPASVYATINSLEHGEGVDSPLSDFERRLQELADGGDGLAGLMQELLQQARAGAELPERFDTGEDTADDDDLAIIEIGGDAHPAEDDEEGEWGDDEEEGGDGEDFEDEGDEDGYVPETPFAMMRNIGEPFAAMAGIHLFHGDAFVQDGKTKLVLVTRGFSHAGFSDLIFLSENESPDGLEGVHDLLSRLYGDLVKGDVRLELGTTIEGDDGEQYVVEKVPEEVKIPPFGSRFFALRRL